MKISITSKLTTVKGEDVKIISVNARGNYPVIGYIGESNKLSYWNLDGNYLNSSGTHNEMSELQLIPKAKGWKNLTIDQPLMVKFSESCSLPRHYAGNGKYHTRGMSSVTNVENSLGSLDAKEWFVIKS